jgi:MFS family permease
VFPHVFFPASISPFVAEIAAFSTFAVGFLVRPFGGIIFGHFGDMIGRKRALVAALLVMGGATTAIGLLPGYATLGVLAPLLLVLLRCLQGIAIGGQWGGAALLAIESAPAGRRGYYGSFVQIGVPVGVVLANIAFLAVNAQLSATAFDAWGWRLPFLFSLLLVGVGLYIQFRVEESAEFEGGAMQGRERRGSPVLEVILSHPKQILLAGGAFIANNICFYIAITYVIAFGATNLHLEKSVMLTGVMIANVVMVPVLILCGHLSDKWGRSGIFTAGAVLTGLWGLVFFPVIETGSPALIALSITMEMALISLMYGPQAALFAELFPVQLRYSGASLGYQLGSVAGGGFAPIVATFLLQKFHTSFAIGLYMCAACAVSLSSILIIRRTRPADQAE